MKFLFSKGLYSSEFNYEEELKTSKMRKEPHVLSKSNKGKLQLSRETFPKSSSSKGKIHSQRDTSVKRRSNMISTLAKIKSKKLSDNVIQDKLCNGLIDTFAKTKVSFGQAVPLTFDAIRVKLLREYGDVLKEGLGKKLANFPPVKITLKDPPYNFPRPISVAKNIPLFQLPAAKKTLKEELDSGVIEKVPLHEEAPTVVWRSIFVMKANFL